jgi:LacI family transcriptional regulator
MVGIKDVARQAGVSVGTVSNVINRPDLVSEQTRIRVQAAIDLLGFVRSESARQLRAGRSRIVAMLVLDMANPFFVQVARGAEREARAAGLGVMLCNSAQDPSEEAEYLSLFAEQRVRGVLVTPADHLLDKGHVGLTYVSGPMHLAQCRDRRTGALAALKDRSLPEDALTHIEVPRLDVDAGRDAGARLLALSRRPTAVFCANDLLALGVLQALYAADVAVPDDVALVGYDDIEFAAAAAVPLTSVRQPAVQMGRTAASLLLEETGDDPDTHAHQRVVLQPELIARESTGHASRP